jgi:voltage-gated potassium channel
MIESRRDRWDHVAEWPLTIAAVLFLAAYAWPILDPDLDPSLVRLCFVVTWATWLLFAADYLTRLTLSVDRRRFFRHNIPDLVVTVLPILRPLRMLRLLTAINVLNRHAGQSLRGRVAVYVAGSTSLVIFVAGLAVLDAERADPEANITAFGDAIWWAMTTVTTVGYGDRFPITGTGRFVAAGLMLAGIALLGIVTASTATWLIDRIRQVEEESEQATRRDIAALATEINALRDEIARLRAS